MLKNKDERNMLMALKSDDERYMLMALKLLDHERYMFVVYFNQRLGEQSKRRLVSNIESKSSKYFSMISIRCYYKSLSKRWSKYAFAMFL